MVTVDDRIPDREKTFFFRPFPPSNADGDGDGGGLGAYSDVFFAKERKNRGCLNPSRVE